MKCVFCQTATFGDEPVHEGKSICFRCLEVVAKKAGYRLTNDGTKRDAISLYYTPTATRRRA